ncbi:M48 family metallopeptidase [Variovorax sp. Sphag1AA]|uniref:M48 family metallopeptidase n=1 Tax=Variovorax sp. Sphag1AA TaxID=2587027 RepID=UPI00161B57C6|nr:M48 family metallopeptidase [Variovorax sp. Sphag1AA]MBB3181972.1 Zn-dependent protease with chaperone function [Variovorax sp. Sphag1AA]
MTTDTLYPAGPAAGGDQLTKATPAYRRHAWLATFALLAFVLAYLAFSGWLAWKAFVLLRAMALGSGDGLMLLGAGVGAGFLAVFMLKALVFVRRGELAGLTEITAAEQPKLFAFLYRLADEARAPRPAKVYLSLRVNAAVFYDLSLLNFILPSKKHLEIGLPLVNMLSVSEFKAVLAHEFGHFAQRSMAVGRWVYLAQQIAAHIVAKRDGLDRFLQGLSRTDVRIAWIGWLFSLLVWAIRSVTDSMFRLVVLADRALSREMEFQADRVSVSLAGSDALIDALYKLQAADAAWDRALEFANLRLPRGYAAPDLLDIQTGVLRKLRVIYDDPEYGVPPSAPAGGEAAHRVFRRDRVSISRMWATHPASHEREQNAKRVFLQAEMSDEPAWALFDQPLALRESLCAKLISHVEPPPALDTREEALAALDAEYDRRSYQRLYRGVYLARFVTRTCNDPAELFDVMNLTEAIAARAELYPSTLSAQLERLDALRHERASLMAVRDGVAKSEGPRLEHRGRVLRKSDVADAIGEVERDIAAAEQALDEHDRRCRSVYQTLAQAAGPAWAEGWMAQVRLLHYAEHVEADLADLRVLLANTFSMVTAKRKVNETEAKRVLADAGALFSAMAAIASQATQLQLGEQTQAALGGETWAEAVGEFNFGHPTRENLNDWLRVVDSWANPMARALGRLRRSALDCLLDIEARLDDAMRSGTTLGASPAGPVVPSHYATLIAGQERPRQMRLDAWSRFQTADGWWAGGARLLVAGGIVTGLMGLSNSSLGNATVLAYNGLDRNVKIQIGGQDVLLAPGAKRGFNLEADKAVEVRAYTTEGQEIESFSANPEFIGANYLYNVAGASPFVSWTAVYGGAVAAPERPLGAPRWSVQQADALLEPPPQSIRTKGGGGTRSVVSAPAPQSVAGILDMMSTDGDRRAMLAVHSEWESTKSATLLEWLMLAMRDLPPEQVRTILQKRVERSPLEVVSLRMQQDLAAMSQERPQVCAQQRELAQKNAGSGDLAYLVVRCMDDTQSKNQAFKKGAVAYPESAWFAYAAGHTWASEQAWTEARQALERAGNRAPYLANAVAVDLARLRRIEKGETAAIDDLVAKSDYLKMQQALQTGLNIPQGNPAQGYVDLIQGRLGKAFALATGAARSQTNLILLVGASNGANEQQVARALEIYDKSTAMELASNWSILGLGIRHGRSTDKALTQLAQVAPDDAAKLKAFVDELQGRKDLVRAEAALAGLTPEQRAQAYCAGLVVLGSKAPPSWRSFVKRAMFPAERPYFG